MRRRYVQSSSIRTVGYDVESRTLELEYLHGGIYQYLDVPPSVHEALMTADSKGRFVADIVKQYDYRRVED